MDYSEDYSRKNPKVGKITKQGLVVGRGKNQRIIPADEVKKLAALHCTYKEMAEFFDVNVETLKYNFRDIITKEQSKTKQALRKAQLKVALDGNTTMLIWLGKQILGQAENPFDSDDSQPLPWID